MADQHAVLDAKRAECESRLAYGGGAGDNVTCEMLWDDILCWPRTAAETLAVQQCPGYFGFQEQNTASKYCTSDGTWYVNDQNQTWTNYTDCIADHYRTSLVTISPYIDNSTILIQWFPVVKTVSQIGYAVSLSTLIVAILIFSSIKKLRCARNRLHMHLFVSFSMRAFMTLLKDTLFVEGVAMESDVVRVEGKIAFIRDSNMWACKFITSAREYFILANFMWILMEGVYLHNLIFTSMFSDNSAITLYVCLGWAIPFAFVISWVIARINFEDIYCWTTNPNKIIKMIIELPISLCVLISFGLFLNIVRVLLVKLNSVYIQRRKVRYRRLIRSTLVLIPLFGVHYMVFLVMKHCVENKPTVELIWIFCDQLFASFQGFCAAMLYCFLNGEVRAELSRKMSTWRERGVADKHAIPYTTTTCRGVTTRASASIPLTDIRKPY